jgi:hypothetical protein
MKRGDQGIDFSLRQGVRKKSMPYIFYLIWKKYVYVKCRKRPHIFLFIYFWFKEEVGDAKSL